MAKSRLDCKRRGIIRLDVGPEAVAATFLPGKAPKPASKALQRKGDRLVLAGRHEHEPIARAEEFIAMLGK